MRRQYRSGSRWAFFRSMDIIIGGELYLRRLHVLHTPWGGVMVHWIPKPDAQRDMHDHPVHFWSFVVRGGYVELTPSGQRMYVSPCNLTRAGRRVWCINRKKPEGIHRIVWVAPNTTTLVFYGPRRRMWGFHTREGWVPWKEYKDPAHVTSRTSDEVVP